MYACVVWINLGLNDCLLKSKECCLSLLSCLPSLKACLLNLNQEKIKSSGCFLLLFSGVLRCFFDDKNWFHARLCYLEANGGASKVWLKKWLPFFNDYYSDYYSGYFDVYYYHFFNFCISFSLFSGVFLPYKKIRGKNQMIIPARFLRFLGDFLF